MLVTTLGSLDGFTLDTYDGLGIGFLEGSIYGAVDSKLVG